MANPLSEIIDEGLDHSIHKWVHYLPIYHRHFEIYKTKPSKIGDSGGGLEGALTKIIILEIGVQNGGSLDLWNKYFGADRCQIFGVDIDPACKQLERDNITIIIGDQNDVEFLNSLVATLPPCDIIIDDGGHTMTQQIRTFNVLFPHVAPGGVFLCEDTHTSYMSSYGGGLKNPASFIEFSKNLIDELTGYHYQQVTRITTECAGMHYYDSMVFFDKALSPIGAPQAPHRFKASNH